MTGTFFTIKSRSIFYLSFILWGLFNNAPVYAQNSGTVQDIDTQRYLALMCLNLTTEKGPELDIIRAAHQNGLNAVYLALPWDKIYVNSPTETPNWARFDEQINLATSLGMKIALRIHIGRHNTRVNAFWGNTDKQISNSGQPMIGGYGDTFFGFDNQPITNKALNFVREAVNRYKYLQTEN
ncbi:MAG TPA: Dystroglycan-type cadherin domain-containing protein, partial [Dyadobacter sp.]|nr:Dystroglycan-type cadherin domain-containing protein [Dyadobacter sp.]